MYIYMKYVTCHYNKNYNIKKKAAKYMLSALKNKSDLGST